MDTAPAVVVRPLTKLPRMLKSGARHAPRPQPAFRSTRAVPVAGSADATIVYGGSNPTSQRMAVVRTGSRKAREEFRRWATRYNLAWEHVGADANAERSGNAPGDDRVAVSEFLIWGRLSDLETFLERNTGDGKPVVSYCDVVAVRVGGTASGSGPCDSATVQKRIRDGMRSRVEREAREARETLNRIPTSNPDSPRHNEREAYARAVAARLAPQLFPDKTPNAREGLTRRLADFIMRHDRVPNTLDEFQTWAVKTG